MRFLSPAFIALTVLVGIGQSPAQKDDAADRQKRLAEISKEIQELQAKIGKLTAEAARLQEAAKPALSPFQGIITALGVSSVLREGRSVPCQAVQIDGRFLLVHTDTQIRYSDQQKAKPSDLKVGQFVKIRAKLVDPNPPIAEVVVIEKAVREISLLSDLGGIAKQVDFAREFLLLVQWTGSPEDTLTLAFEEGKAGPVVDFTFQPGSARVQELP